MSRSTPFAVASGLSLALILAGCTATSPGTPPPPGGTPAGCEATANSLTLGQPVVSQPDGSATVGGQQVSNSGSIRVYEQGSPVTQDFRPDRLNLETDSSGNLVRAYCG